VIIAKKPSDCSHAELQDFERLVRAGGEVTAAGLNARIKNAAVLVYISQSNCVTGIAALKKPQEQYKHRVFQKAGATARPNEFPLELGWIFVVPASRGAGLSHKLVEAAIDASDGRGIFATSRADNAAMHRVLKVHGFSNHGHAYASERSNHELVLFLRNAA
jgi:GNAT superfamily N-acetyltransferase